MSTVVDADGVDIQMERAEKYRTFEVEVEVEIDVLAEVVESMRLSVGGRTAI